MPSAAEGILGRIPRCFEFHPTDEELVEFYLLPRARGGPAPFPGVVIEDDAAGSARPWELLDRHGRGHDKGAYFYVRGQGGADAGSGKARRQGRRCRDGGGTWKAQSRLYHDLLVGGGEEKIRWSKNHLSLHMGGGGGSSGWVMHEYTVVEPPCPSIKICHVVFSGYGQKRKRVPDDDQDDRHTAQPKRIRVAAAPPSDSAATAKQFDQETEHQETEQVQESPGMEHLLEGDGLLDMDGEELLALLKVDLESFCQVPDIGDVAAGGTLGGVPDLGEVTPGSSCAVQHIGDKAAGTRLGYADWGGFNGYQLAA